LDLNANERLLEIQAEIVTIEKRRLYEKLTEDRKQELKSRIDFLVSEQRMIFESKYKNQNNQRFIEKENGELKQILKNEIDEERKIEGELKEIKKATESRMWYEKWWGKLIIIVVGAVLVSLMGNGTVNLTELIG
jgi:uncharacterized protein with ACT and thioredoxin-like domain